MPDLKVLKIYMKVFAQIATAVMLIPITFALYNKKHLNKPLKIFLWYCIASFLVNLIHQAFIWAVNNYQDIFVPLLNKWQIKDTNFMGILAFTTNFAFLGWYFYTVMPHEKTAKGIRWLSSSLFIAAIIDYLFIGDFRDLGVFTPAASAIFCFVLPAIHLWFLYRDDAKVPLSKNPYFWIAMGLFLPHLASFFLYFMGDTIHKEDFSLFVKISIGKISLSMIGQVLLAVGFYYARYSKFLPLRAK